MADNPIYTEIANITYFFFELIALEIIVSFVFVIDYEHHTVKWRRFLDKSSQFKKTSTVVCMIIIIALLYYYAERAINQPAVDYFISLENTLLPLSVLSVSFFAFYLTKVFLGRNWRLPFTISTLSISLISTGFFIYFNYFNK